MSGYTLGQQTHESEKTSFAGMKSSTAVSRYLLCWSHVGILARFSGALLVLIAMIFLFKAHPS